MKSLMRAGLVCILLTGFVFALTNVVDRQVTGVGKTRQAAINAALYQAVSQVNGVQLDSGQMNVVLDSATVAVDSTEGDKTVDIDAVAVAAQGTTLLTDVKGLVKTYEVLAEEQLPEKGYRVKLNVSVYDYTADIDPSLKRLAVMPIHVGPYRFVFYGAKSSSAEICRIFSSKLSDILTSSNRFTILDRQYVSEIASQQKLLTTDAVSNEERAKAGQLLATDYMLTGTINRAEIKRKDSFSQAIGTTTSEYQADLDFQYRLIVASTGQVLHAGSVVIDMENNDVKKLVKKWEGPDTDFIEMRNNLLAKAAEMAADDIVDRIYPVQIVKVAADGSVILTKGAAKSNPHDTYDVIAQGPQLTDPATGRSLGTEEKKAGLIKIEQVSQIVNYGKVIQGTNLKSGMICRKQINKTKETKRPVLIKSAPNRGVKLPFDK